MCETGGNWKFDLTSKEWHRLAGTPVAQISSFHNSNNKGLLLNRYMLLVGGCEIWNWKKGSGPKDHSQCYTGSPGWG
jgi:hypothetical protein